MRPFFLLCAASIALIASGCSGNGNGSIEASGTIEGTEINVAAEVAGRILAVPVNEGARVNRGDTLAIINDEEYRLQLKQAEANLASLEAAFRLAAAGSRKEDVIQAEAAYTSANADYQRMKELLASATITQKQYDDAYARYVAADQTYRKAKSGLRPEEINGARARRDGAVAQVDLLQKRIRDCAVLAPAPGTLTLRAVEPGELVGMGSNIARLTYLDRVKLTIYVNEADLGRVALGQGADVTIDTFPGKPFAGRVVSISPNAEFTPKNVQTKEERTKLVFAVKLEIENPEGSLKPGLPADAVLRTAGKAQ
ncbi:MAG: efflux RND transporter periplasmic adaptor subunit [Ignavibacteriae bacterium]|nr:efflux RND transporter periplasmic adaptor subunit [Ignavibacteriota bacterium]